MEIKKNQEYVVEIIDNGYEGEGIAKINNFAIFISNAIKGEKVRIVIVKVLTTHAFGKIIEIIKKSPNRREEDCDTYKRCGGCNLRHIDYIDTLNIKTNIIQNLVNKTLQNKLQVEQIIGMENPYNYRNKAQFPFGFNSKGEEAIGVFANRTHEVIPFNNCIIQNEEAVKIAKFVFNFIRNKKISIYNEKTGKGIFRHIIIKTGFKTKEIMCVLVINNKKFNYENELVLNLIQEFPNIKTIVKNINNQNTNVILGRENIILYGQGYIFDKLKNYVFKISPNSFYQTNPVQTEVLYNIVVEELKNNANINQKTLFDLYCGIGTISIFVSKYVKKVYGIEIIEEAIKDANENAILNNVRNVQFIAGDVEKELDKLVNIDNVKADIVIVDPPRKGLDTISINNIINIKPEKIIYISCNPATLVRDLKLLEEKYKTTKIQPVDMFPFTSHVECVAIMGIK